MNLPSPAPRSAEWYALVVEPVLDAERPIIDTHHHFWEPDESPNGPYRLAELWADTGSGHYVERTVFLECHAQYRTEGPEHLRAVGETEYVARLATESRAAAHQVGDGTAPAVVSAIIGNADMRLGDSAALLETLDAHEVAGKGLFRGIRHAVAHDPHPEGGAAAAGEDPRLLLDDSFQAGGRLLGRRGLLYESWQFHTQLGDVLALAQAAPETTIIVDHLGGVLQRGWFRDRQDEVWTNWSRDTAALARLPNVHMKLGGLVQPSVGFDRRTAPRPLTSDELVAAHERFYQHAIDCFGATRCMFESNFPVDKASIGYRSLWNAFKKMTATLSPDDLHALFYGTAERVYRI